MAPKKKATKKTTTNKPDEEKNEKTAPDRLSEVVFEGGDENDSVGIDVAAGEAIDGIHGIDSTIAQFGEFDVEEGVLAHTFYKTLEGIAKAGLDFMKAPLVSLAQKTGGKIEGEIGKISVTTVAASVERVYTDDTVSVLEAAGVLPQSVEMSATMREGVDVERITDQDMEVIEKYFEVVLAPSHAKIESLISLGKLDRKPVEDTMTEQEKRKGYDRLLVKPTDELVEYFAGSSAVEVTS